ncbi:MAG: MaoC/PaaZ C-terminal domain-containing protein [Alphaproteobacteria bacterium]|nr:MaoC/PaaZ C-terminal domain-containing protein [Alphaproteobacteria bacterium]
MPPRAPAPQRGFEDFRVGETFHAPSRTHSDSLFYAFQLASGDNAPVHYDIEHCRRRGWPGLMAHGFQTLIQTAPGATGLAAEMEDALIGFLDQSSRVLKPVFSGDTLYPELEIAALEPQRHTGVMTLVSRVWNQRDELVLEGEMRFLLRLREPRIAAGTEDDGNGGGNTGMNGGGAADRR